MKQILFILLPLALLACEKNETLPYYNNQGQSFTTQEKQMLELLNGIWEQEEAISQIRYDLTNIYYKSGSNQVMDTDYHGEAIYYPNYTQIDKYGTEKLYFILSNNAQNISFYTYKDHKKYKEFKIHIVSDSHLTFSDVETNSEITLLKK